MKKRGLFFLALAFVTLAVRPGAARAAYAVGDVCTQGGETRLSDDRKDILACLFDDLGALHWKPMSSPPSTILCPSGKVLQSMINGVPNCVDLVAPSTSCPGGQVLQGIVGGAPNCVALPAGPTNCTGPLPPCFTGSVTSVYATMSGAIVCTPSGWQCVNFLTDVTPNGP